LGVISKGYLGSAGIDLDKFFRTLGFYKSAKESIPYLKNATLAALNSYADVNTQKYPRIL
jgi:acyl-homoserine lactone acylase PvdQ